MYDTHVHSTFSADGISTFEEYAKLIKKANIKAVGFTEHVDFLPECGAYGFFNYEKFISSVKKYRSLGYNFYAGAEIDYAKQVEKDILFHLKNKKYDYIICSVHMIDGISISNRKDILNVSDRKRLKDIIEKYYNQIFYSANIKEFDVIGHIGVYKRYLGNDYFQKKDLFKIIQEMDDETARICAANDKIVEVNTSGLSSPCASTIPDSFFLKRYYSYGGRTISIGSDAHKVEDVAKGFDHAVETLKRIGFKYMILPWNRQEISM